MAINLTASAAERVRSYLAQQPGAVGLRLGVRKTGCSGWAYQIGMADEVSTEDRIFEDHGIKVVVSADALKLIDGTTVDFVKEGLNELFRFENPNVKDECGCGESFSV